MNTIQTILTSLGGSAAITLAIIKWSSGLLQSKITMNWDHQHKTELELIKSNLQSNQEVIKLALSNLPSNNQKLLEKQLIAVEDLWKHILELREELSAIRMYLSTLMPDEYNRRNEAYYELFSYMPISQEKLNEYTKEYEELEVHRVYLGEVIWSLFSLYRAFILRLHIKFDEEKVKNAIQTWNSDAHLVNIVKIMIDSVQFNEIDLRSPGSLNKSIEKMENKILFEIEKIVTGSNSTERNYNEARRLMELAANENSMMKPHNKINGNENVMISARL